MKQLTKEELSEILKQHKIWLESDHKLGSKANLSGAYLSGANLYKTDLEEANLSGASLSGADLEGANLSGANLSGVNLSRANLFRTSLYGVNLSGANLSDANLYGAKGITIFQHEQHLAVAFKNNKYIKIGCKSYKTINWVKNFEKIGEDEDYLNSQIKMYGQFINMINEQQST